jgi:hypothetical protein
MAGGPPAGGNSRPRNNPRQNSNRTLQDVADTEKAGEFEENVGNRRTSSAAAMDMLKSVSSEIDTEERNPKEVEPLPIEKDEETLAEERDERRRARRDEKHRAKEEKERLEEEKGNERDDDEDDDDGDAGGGEASLALKKMCLKGDQSSVKALKRLLRDGEASVFDKDPHG